jgi:hypothetical protein
MSIIVDICVAAATGGYLFYLYKQLQEPTTKPKPKPKQEQEQQPLLRKPPKQEKQWYED